MKPIEADSLLAEALVEAARTLSAEVDALSFAAPVSHVTTRSTTPGAQRAVPEALRREPASG